MKLLAGDFYKISKPSVEMSGVFFRGLPPLYGVVIDNKHNLPYVLAASYMCPQGEFGYLGPHDEAERLTQDEWLDGAKAEGVDIEAFLAKWKRSGVDGN